jgi:hypothetical protein
MQVAKVPADFFSAPRTWRVIVERDLERRVGEGGRAVADCERAYDFKRAADRPASSPAGAGSERVYFP